MAMLRLAIAGQTGLVAESHEIDRLGASYMVDTIDVLTRSYPDSTFSLIIGLDVLFSFGHWHRWQSILATVSLLVMARPGYRLQTGQPDWLAPYSLFQYDTLSDLSVRSFIEAGKIHLIPVSPMDISATHIRQRLKAGKDVAAMLHPDVRQYIDQHKLYA